MTKLFSPFLNIFLKKNKKEKDLADFIKFITGKPPKNISVYLLAFKHSSINKDKKDCVEHSNERLEFLGDAVLGAVVADYLFKKFPYKDEGFLTEIRSRIVNGESLGNLARKIGLTKFIQFNARGKNLYSHKYMYGDAMEALVGAVYLDRGYKFCKKFILESLIEKHIDIDQVVTNDVNYKSKLIMWAQNRSKTVKFDIIDEKDHKHYKEFTARISIDGQEISIGKASSKKKAEQNASRKAIEIIAN